MYIEDKLEPSKEGSQQDSPGLTSYFPPMKTGLVEYANKKPKDYVLTSCVVWHDKGDGDRSQLWNKKAGLITMWSSNTDRDSHQNYMNPQNKTTNIMALIQNAMFWASNLRSKLEVDYFHYLTAHSTQQGIAKIVLPWSLLPASPQDLSLLKWAVRGSSKRLALSDQLYTLSSQG